MKRISGSIGLLTISIAVVSTLLVAGVLPALGQGSLYSSPSQFRLISPAEALTGIHLWSRENVTRRWTEFESKGEPVNWKLHEDYFPRMRGLRAVDLVSKTRAFKALIIDNNEVLYESPEEKLGAFLWPEILVFVLYPSTAYDSILQFCRYVDVNSPVGFSPGVKHFCLPVLTSVWVGHGETVDHCVNENLPQALDPSDKDTPNSTSGLSLSIMPFRTAEGPVVRFVASRNDNASITIEDRVFDTFYYEVSMRHFVAFMKFLNREPEPSADALGMQ